MGSEIFDAWIDSRSLRLCLDGNMRSPPTLNVHLLRRNDDKLFVNGVHQCWGTSLIEPPIVPLSRLVHYSIKKSDVDERRSSCATELRRVLREGSDKEFNKTMDSLLHKSIHHCRHISHKLFITFKHIHRLHIIC